MKWLLGILAAIGGVFLTLLGRTKADTKPLEDKRDASLAKADKHVTKAKTAKKRAKTAKSKAKQSMETKDAATDADVAARFNRLRKRKRS